MHTSPVRECRLLNVDVSEREAILTYAWSRPAVIDSQSVGGRQKEARLPFEGFLEALCRLSILKALPSDEDIQTAGEADAGSFLLNLEERDTASFNSFLSDPSTHAEWGEEPRGKACEAVSRRVTHLLHLIIRVIEGRGSQAAGGGDGGGGGGGGNMELSAAEMSKWTAKNMKGASPKKK